MDVLRLGIIGHPLGHSLSPLLHAHLMEIMNLTGEYCRYDIPPENLAAALDELSNQNLRGLNVTVPHKVAVMPLLDWHDPQSQLIGAANTIVFEEFGRHKKGYNTDVTGFVRSLPPVVSERLPESNVLVLGAGGAARAVVAGLMQLNVAGITLAVRNLESAMSLVSQAERLKQAFQADTDLMLGTLDELPDLTGFQGLINTTPVGMWPHTEESLMSRLQLETLPAGSFIYDLIYRPLETRLLQDARVLGYHTINGLDMLIHQGIASFELWQDQPVPPDMVAPLRQQLAHELVHQPQAG